MPSSTTYSALQLAAVNEILGSVGQAPVTNLDQTNPEVAIAYTALMDISREVQAEGWVFNREYGYEVTPDNSGYISLPGNMLSMDLSDIYENSGYDTVIREGKLYDKINHTNIWDTSETYKVDVVWYLDFDDLPAVFRDYVAARAATRCATRLVGDTNLVQTLGVYEGWRRANCIEYECSEGDYSMFGFSKGDGFYNSYQPFKALAR
jgi:hypothetical protein